MLLERIQIPPETPGEQKRILRDDGDLAAEIVQPDVEHLDAVDDDAAGGFRQSEQRCQEAGLPRPGPSHDPDLLVLLGGEVDTPQHVLLILVVSEVDVTELDHAAVGPRLGGHVVRLRGGGLLGQVSVLHHPLHSSHQVLNLKLSKLNKINFKYIKKIFMKDLFHSVKYVMKNKNINKNENYEIEVKFSNTKSCYAK